MPNILKVLPLTILLTLATSAGAATTGNTDSAKVATATATTKTASATKARISTKTTKTTSSKSRSSTTKVKTTSTTSRASTKKTKASSRTSRSSTRTAKAAAAPAPLAGAHLGNASVGAPVSVESGAALVVDDDGQVIYAKNADEVLPIASITKLMTALVVLDARLPLDELITITEDDKDYLRNTHSRLRIGSQLTRRELLHISLMSSENRAAAALGRTYPAGTQAFVRLMNAKARALGMLDTRFADSTGLDGNNVSTARDLVKLARAASDHALIREFTTTAESEVEPAASPAPMLYRNSNRLVRAGHWDIQLSKTGYLNEAGRCLVMQAAVAGKPVTFVFLSGPGRQTPMGDANRIRVWLENDARTS